MLLNILLRLLRSFFCIMLRTLSSLLLFQPIFGFCMVKAYGSGHSLLILERFIPYDSFEHETKFNNKDSPKFIRFKSYVRELQTCLFLIQNTIFIFIPLRGLYSLVFQALEIYPFLALLKEVFEQSSVFTFSLALYIKTPKKKYF